MLFIIFPIYLYCSINRVVTNWLIFELFVPGTLQILAFNSATRLLRLPRLDLSFVVALINCAAVSMSVIVNFFLLLGNESGYFCWVVGKYYITRSLSSTTIFSFIKSIPKLLVWWCYRIILMETSVGISSSKIYCNLGIAYRTQRYHFQHFPVLQTHITFESQPT